jgi:DNA-directed RNA polymerase specialized sigma24 family protein
MSGVFCHKNGKKKLVPGSISTVPSKDRQLNRKTFNLLREADWGELGKRLLAFAEWRARYYWWRHGKGIVLAKGWTPEDVVQEVIIKTLSGERNWDPQKGHLEPWLRDQVKSVMDALVRSAAHKREVIRIDHHLNAANDDTMKTLIPEETLANPETAGPEELVLDQESTELIEQQAASIFQAVDGESELEAILFAIMVVSQNHGFFLLISVSPLGR